MKHRPPAQEKTNIVYKILCKDCLWSYGRETGRSLKTRASEHIRSVKQHRSGWHITKHGSSDDHGNVFDKAKVIDKGFFRSRSSLESRHTDEDKNADNISSTIHSFNYLNIFHTEHACFYITLYEYPSMATDVNINKWINFYSGNVSSLSSPDYSPARANKTHN